MSIEQSIAEALRPVIREELARALSERQGPELLTPAEVGTHR